jgi:hypothetical protein
MKSLKTVAGFPGAFIAGGPDLRRSLPQMSSREGAFAGVDCVYQPPPLLMVYEAVATVLGDQPGATAMALIVMLVETGIAAL